MKNQFKKFIIFLLSGLLFGSFTVYGLSEQYDYNGIIYRIPEEDYAIIIGYNGNAEELVIPSELSGYEVKGFGSDDISTYGAHFPIEFSGELIITDGIKYIGNAMFKDSRLQSVSLPNSLEWMGNSVFEKCTSLKEIEIPPLVSYLGQGVFRDCESLESVRILNNIVGERMFCECKNLKNVYLGDNVTTIGNVAFGHCPSLETVVIPESVETIGEGAFIDCTSLKNVVFMGKNTGFKEEFEILNPYYGYSPTFGNQENGYFDYGGSIENLYAFKGTQAQEYARNNQIDFTPVVSVKLNGEYIKADVPAVIKNNRTLIPMRAIFEALGADVDWQEESKTVTAQRADKSVQMQIGSLNMQVDGRSVTTDAAPEILFDRTLIPVRAAGEALGAEVNWNEEEQTVEITVR